MKQRYAFTVTTRTRFEIDANDRAHAIYLAEHPDEWLNIEEVSRALSTPILIGEVPNT